MFNPLCRSITSDPYRFEKRLPSAVLFIMASLVSNYVSVLVHETAVVSGVVSKLSLLLSLDLISYHVGLLK